MSIKEILYKLILSIIIIKIVLLIIYINNFLNYL